MIEEKTLRSSLSVLDIPRSIRKTIESLMDDYLLFDGILVWDDRDIPKLQVLVRSVLGIKDSELLAVNEPEDLMNLVRTKLKKCSVGFINATCYVLTYVE